MRAGEIGEDDSSSDLDDSIAARAVAIESEPCESCEGEIEISATLDPGAGETEPTPMTCSPEAGPLRPPRGRMLHVFAGVPRVGSFVDAGDCFGVLVTSVDVLLGGSAHDVCSPTIQAALLADVASGGYDVVWIGTPCASCSVLWLDGTAKPPRTRLEPDGTSGLPAWQQDYLERHNGFISFSATLAQAAFDAGATFVVENPVDLGMRGSPYYQWRKRQHCPLWLTTPMRELARRVSPTWASGCQCMLGGDFRKATTLMSGGPRAQRIASFSALRCVHATHARVAYGTDSDGLHNSAAAAAYPMPMCFWAVETLFALAPVSAVGYADLPAVRGAHGAARALNVENVEAAAAFVDALGVGGSPATEGDAGVAVPHAPWRAAPASMPAHWPETADVLSGASSVARAAELPYISRRRAEPEDDETLAARPMEKPHVPPHLPARPLPEHVAWPAGAPARPIHISRLYHPGVYDDILAAIDSESKPYEEAFARIDGGDERATISKGTTHIFRAAECQPEWASAVKWDCSDPDDCVPLQPNSRADPPDHPLNAAFFEEWGRRLEWADLDMLMQAAVTGAESRTMMSGDTVIMGHHGGLRARPSPARASVDSDTRNGWMTGARRHLWTVPARLVPKNVVTQHKWRADSSGELYLKLKYRVTTDDSIEPADDEGSVTSRNSAMDREAWGNVPLSTPRTTAEALAIVKSVASGMGMVASPAALERVALWAIDLSDAHRIVASARSERWQQQFLWAGGVKLDLRCVFGAAHMVDLFQRISTFVLAVATHRIQMFDQQRPYSMAREAWRRWRSERTGTRQEISFQSIYIDDGSGLTVLGEGEPLRGAAPGGPRTAAGLSVEPSRAGETPRVRLHLYHNHSRPEIHLAIVRRTFEEAGWGVADDKVQLDFWIELLGLGIDSEGDGCVFVPDVKRRGMLRDIASMLDVGGAARARGTVDRADVETLTGRCSHLAQVVCEGNAFLQPLYRFQNARWAVASPARKRRVAGGRPSVTSSAIVKVRPRRLQLCGKSPAQAAFSDALRWWRAAFESDVTVPLAPRRVFPEVGEPGVAFFFTDAAREDGTGFGAHATVEIGGTPTFLFYEERWSSEALAALQADRFSMPAGECFGAVVFADALLSELGGATHLVIYTDSDATARAVTTAGSGSPQLNLLIQWLLRRHPGVQLLGVHQPGVRNSAADGLSRDGRRGVLNDAVDAGLALRELAPAARDVEALLAGVLAAPLGNA